MTKRYDYFMTGIVAMLQCRPSRRRIDCHNFQWNNGLQRTVWFIRNALNLPTLDTLLLFLLWDIA
jgi:hypothetical protein